MDQLLVSIGLNALKCNRDKNKHQLIAAFMIV